ncbi:MAG: superoxide dismutase [Erysipelotrichales bacterium]|nr:superoxide dismutase [Erysipelotrichales bacterium]
MSYQNVELKYNIKSLEPLLSEESFVNHYHRLYNKFTKDLNNMLEIYSEFKKYPLDVLLYNYQDLPPYIKLPLLNTGSNYYNHTLFFENIESPSQTSICSEFNKAINDAFGSMESLQAILKKALMAIEGSGWVFLTCDICNNLHIKSYQDHYNPLIDQKVPLLAIDNWEHAYIFQYKEKRSFYINNIIKLINWNKVSERFLAVDFTKYQVKIDI